MKLLSDNDLSKIKSKTVNDFVEKSGRREIAELYFENLVAHIINMGYTIELKKEDTVLELNKNLEINKK